MPKKPKIDRVECMCPVSYTITERNGRMVAQWDQEPPSLMQMCFGRCQRCGLPYHTEFTATEPV
jgi:hypothetical protein